MKTLSEAEQLRVDVAIFCMGWKQDVDKDGDAFGWLNSDGTQTRYWGTKEFDWLPDVDMNCAWLVAERMRALGFGVSIEGAYHGYWSVYIAKPNTISGQTVSDDGALPCEAICRAALWAVQYDEKEVKTK